MEAGREGAAFLFLPTQRAQQAHDDGGGSGAARHAALFAVSNLKPNNLHHTNHNKQLLHSDALGSPAPGNKALGKAQTRRLGRSPFCRRPRSAAAQPRARSGARRAPRQPRQLVCACLSRQILRYKNTCTWTINIMNSNNHRDSSTQSNSRSRPVDLLLINSPACPLAWRR